MVAITKLAAALCGLMPLLGTALGQGNSTDWPLHDDGLTDLVEWQVCPHPRQIIHLLIRHFNRDHYSFHVNGQRLFVFSGEVINSLHVSIALVLYD